MIAASSAMAQAPRGSWNSPPSVTFTNPALAGSELFLSLEIAADGRFTGTWGQYQCTSFPGAYGIAVISCSNIPRGAAVGTLDANGTGSARLAELGQSTFTWRLDERGTLVFDFPKKGAEAILTVAHLTSGGAGAKPAKTNAPAPAPARVSSAVALYREFVSDSAAATRRYAGKSVELEGTRGTLIEFSDGVGGAVHIPDGTQPRALVLMFDAIHSMKGVAEGAVFKARCTVEHFDYQYVQLRGCKRVE